MFIIAIGRQYGSGGRFIAKKLSELLSVAYYDQELIYKASQKSGLDPAILETYDETKETLFAGISSFQNNGQVSLPFSQQVFITQSKVILDIAKKESAIIVGRCADYILRDNKNVLSVFITSPIDKRIERAVKHYGLEKDKAEKRIVKMDKKRKKYYEFFTGRKWGKSDNYNLTIDSSIGIEETAEVIANFAKTVLKLK